MLGTTVAGAGSYLLAALVGRWLPPVVLWVVFGVVVASLGTAWLLVGRRSRGVGFPAGVGVPLHIALLATGGLASPLAPALAIWLFPLVRRWSERQVYSFGAAALVWLIAVEAIWGRLVWPGVVEGVLIFAAGILPALVIGRIGSRVQPRGDESGDGSVIALGGESESPAGTSSRRVDELATALDRICTRLGGDRAVLWEIDAPSGKAHPRLVSGGIWPPPVTVAGDPIGLALDEGVILRLETSPRWAADSTRTVVVPLERPGTYTTALTIEYLDDVDFPTIPVLEEASSFLRALLDLQREAELARIARDRFGSIVALLGRLAQKLDVDEFATQLALAMRDFMGMSGAAVARWDHDAGRIIAVVGDDGGAPAGTEFALEESELALAAANGAPLIRDRRRGVRSQLPILAPGERWYAEPRSILILPLDNPAIGVVGVLALWDVEPTPVDDEQLEILKVVVPYAAMLLHQLQLYGPLQEFAERDPLTGLYNRRVFEERLAAEDARFLRYGRATSLLILDIDHFKEINDTHGHEAGDVALKALARVVQAATRETDLAARLGGEEFVVLLPETPLAGAVEIAERLRSRVEELEVEWEGKTIPLRVSVGVASAPECAVSPARLPAVADAALYASKRGGRNRVTVAPYHASH